MPRTKKPILTLKKAKAVKAAKKVKGPSLNAQKQKSSKEIAKAIINSLTLVANTHKINSQPTKVVRGIKINKDNTKVKIYYQNQK